MKVSDITVDYLDHMGSDLTVVNAARVSMSKWHESFADIRDTRLIEYLAEHNHWSPFAHAFLQIRVKAPIFVARQLVKHQVGLAWNECYSEDTEVLTDSGWKFWKDVNDSDLLATPKTDGKSYSFLKPLELIRNEYNGEMIHVYSRDLDMLVTPNHDQFIQYYTGRKGKTWTDYEKMPTKLAVKKKFARTLPVPCIDYPEGNDYWEGKLYGAFLGDGSLSKDSKRIYFHVKKEKKKLMLRELSEHTEEYSWNENKQDDGYSYFRIKNISGWNGHVNTKKIEIYKKTKSFLKGLYDGLLATDGHITDRNNTSFSTTSKKMADTLDELAYLMGFDTTLHIRKKQGNWNESYKYTFKVTRPRILRYSETVNYKGTVYCAVTETGLLIVRRNGKSCVSGNCSRRYVDSEPEFYVPELRKRAENVKQGSSDEVVLSVKDEDGFELDGQAVLKRMFAISLQCYETLLKNGAAPEVARSVLPQSMMTEWVWSGSLYAFARVCNLRLDSHAQKETRLVAEQIFKLLEMYFPVSTKALINIGD